MTSSECPDEYQDVRRYENLIQNVSFRALTTLATFYIPLSFVAGIFGMNVTTFNPEIKVPIWIYFVVALPVTAASMSLVWYYTWLRQTLPTMIRRTSHWRPYWLSRVFRRRVPAGAVAKGLVGAGGIISAPGRPRRHARTTHDELMNVEALGNLPELKGTRPYAAQLG